MNLDLSFDKVFFTIYIFEKRQIKMEGQIVEFTGQIEELKLDHLKLFINDLGGQISVQKQLKFEDLGLAEVEKGIFQCLVCSKVIKRKDNAVTHFKKLHTDQVDIFFLFD